MMEEFTLYQKQRKLKPNYIPAPPYCREYESEFTSEEFKTTRLEVSDPGKILVLTESLMNNNTLDLEKKLNYYVS